MQKKKKIKGQIPGVHYSWLIGLAEKRRTSVSDVLTELAEWVCNSSEFHLPMPLVEECRSAKGAHTYLNFNADARLLAKWERFKALNNVKADSQGIRLIVRYRYNLAKNRERMAVPTKSGKPIRQQRFTF